MIIPTVYGMLLMLLIAGVRKYDVFISMQNMVDSYPQNNRNAFDNNSSLTYLFNCSEFGPIYSDCSKEKLMAKLDVF